MKRKAFYIFFVLLGVALVLVSTLSFESSNAIIARVESEKTAISYRKPVQVNKIFVNAGQRVSKGDTLLIVSRPDLLLDRAKLENQKLVLESDLKRLNSDYQSRIALLNVEETGKIQRLQADIDHLQSELQYQEALYANLRDLSKSQKDSLNEAVGQNPDVIRLESYKQELGNLKKYYQSERSRLALLLAEDKRSLELKMENLSRDFQALEIEQQALIRLAPFSGTIGTVNSQLEELIPEFNTIMTLFAENPSKIKAFANLNTEYRLGTGQTVIIESANGRYKIEGTVLEIGARIVEYQNPSTPTEMMLYGREVFISLPPDNEFLYGEQVIVYPPTE